MTQVTLWNTLHEPGITAIVGAGGKTRILTKLVEYGLFSALPMVMTTTTRMLEAQVAQWQPYYGHAFSDAETACVQAVSRRRCGAWFPGVSDEKVESVLPQEVDAMHRLHPDWHIIVEADGAKRKWLKAPKKTEPQIPSLTKATIGVLNLQAMGASMEDSYVHNIDLVMKITGAHKGDEITPSMIARLVQDKHGLFQYARGKKYLFCTGYHEGLERELEILLDLLAGQDLHSIYIASGYDVDCKIEKAIKWK